MRKTHYTVASVIVIIAFVGLLVLLTLSGCNYQMADLNYDFDYAYITFGDGVVEKIEIKSWRDYEDGEQIQITATDGTIYLTSSFNCTLVKEGK